MYQRHKYKADLSLDTINNPVGSIKYDGAHFFMRFDNAGKPAFISRRMSVKGHYPDRTEKLPQFHDIRLPQHAGNIYSVELIHTGHRPDAVESHPSVSGILNSLAPRAIETQKTTGPIRAVLLDVIQPFLETYGDKLKHLKDLEAKISKPGLVFAPEIKTGVKDIQKLVKSTLREGREGVIATSLTDPDAKSTRLKIVHKKTYNLLVTGMKQEMDINGNLKASMGALELADATRRKVGWVGTGFDHKTRAEAFRNPALFMNQLVQVSAKETENGNLRMPVYNGFADGDIDTV